MVLCRQRDRQAEMLVTWSELPRSPGHVFYKLLLQQVLILGGIRQFRGGHVHQPLCGGVPPSVAAARAPLAHAADTLLRRHQQSTWPGMAGADKLSLRELRLLTEREGVPDNSWQSPTRSRLPLELYEQVFTWVLHRLAEHGLIRGEWIGVDTSTMETNSGLRGIRAETAHRRSGRHGHPCRARSKRRRATWPCSRCDTDTRRAGRIDAKGLSCAGR